MSKHPLPLTSPDSDTFMQLKPEHAVFVLEMIQHGNRRKAYQTAYPGVSDRSAYSAAARLLSEPSVATSIMKIQLETRQFALNTLKEQYLGKLADIEEKRMMLACIIRGELAIEKEVTKTAEKTITTQKAGPKEIIQAIKTDNKMEEDWAKAMILPDKGIKYLE